MPKKSRIHTTQKEITDMLAKGIIEESNTDFISPVVIRTKKDGKLRICLDPKAFNSIARDQYNEPPNVESILYARKGAHYYTILDYACGFWQIPVVESDTHYFGFQISGQTYKFNVLPYGTKISASEFIRAINNILRPIINDEITTYVDDILIQSQTFENHLKNLITVLKEIHKAGNDAEPTKNRIFLRRGKSPWL